MTMDIEQGYASGGDSDRPRRSLAFLGTLAISAVVFFLTNGLVLAVILPCLHGGWHSMETAFWLLKSDPCRRRARVCFAFCLATAFWKAAAAALLTVFVLIVAEKRIGVQANMDEFAALMLVVAGGVVVNTLLGIGATIAAVSCKIQVWIHPRLRSMVRGNLNRVSSLRPLQCGFNHAVFVVATALVFPVLCIGTVCLTIATVGKGRNEVASISGILLVFATMFGGSFAMIPCYAWLSSRIIARTPGQCWPENTIQVESE